jgi:outer membrane protein
LDFETGRPTSASYFESGIIMLKKAFLLFLAACIPSVRAGESPGGWQTLDLTLNKAIQMALQKNFSITIQKFDPKVSRELVRSATGKFDPAFSLSYKRGEFEISQGYRRDANNVATRYSENYIEQTNSWSTGVNGVTVWGLGYDLGVSSVRSAGTNTGFQGDYVNEMSFSLTQPLLRGAGTAVNLANVRVARNNVTISEWGVKQQVMNVITDVIQAYNDLQYAIENLGVAQRSKELAMQLLRDNIKRVEIGVKTPLDVTTAQAEAAAREEVVIRFSRVVKDRENFLKKLITADLMKLLRTRVRIAPPPEQPFVPNVVAGVKAGLELRPDYRQAKLEIENKNITVVVTKNDTLPQLDLVASLRYLGLDDEFGTSFQRLASGDRSAWNVGATFSIPIGNHQARGRYSAAKLEVMKALVQLQQLEQEIIVLVDNAAGAVVTAREQMDASREALRLARESLAAGETRLIAGTGTTFEVLELQKKLAEVEITEILARAAFNTAIARYHLETGTTLRVHGVKVE